VDCRRFHELWFMGEYENCKASFVSGICLRVNNAGVVISLTDISITSHLDHFSFEAFFLCVRVLN